MNDILATVKGLMEAALSAKITTFYQGEAQIVPKSYLPALMVYGDQTTVSYKDTCRDVVGRSIAIKVITNLMNYVDESGTDDVIKHMQDMYDIMESYTGGEYDGDTVIGVLRSNPDIFKLDGPTTINYNSAQAGEFFYIYGIVTVELNNQLIKRP